MSRANTHTSRESWLRAATDELRPYFEKLGYPLPDNIRFSLAFTSAGKRENAFGAECWHPDKSNDQNYEIYVAPNIDQPADVVGYLIHALCHTVLPATAKHGPAFKAVALAVGLEGKMARALPGLLLRERVHEIVLTLGSLPHARLRFELSADDKRPQRNRWLKAECDTCGWFVNITAKNARLGLPICAADTEHGVVECEALGTDSDKDKPAEETSSAENSPVLATPVEFQQAAEAF